MAARSLYLRLLLLMTAMSAAAVFSGCLSPDGGHGESCQARNDCRRGFACINGMCAKDNFPISIENGKDCVLIDCETTADCCGDRPTSAPPKCDDRARYCELTLPNCSPISCTSADQCGGGTCSVTGSCALSLILCTSNDDCTNTCVVDAGMCAFGVAACASDNDCTDSCMLTPGFCNCTNPEYDPTHPICNDSDCDEICDLTCSPAKRCTTDTFCESDGDCAGDNRCNAEGQCVQCLEDAHCDDDERCRGGFCELPCSADEHCGIFEACEAGECVYVGCKSDRECVLWGNAAPGRDAREAECVKIDGSDVRQCVIPCDSDRECAATERCRKGVCTYIGCEDDLDCRAQFGQVHQPRDRPYVSEALCVDIDG